MIPPANPALVATAVTSGRFWLSVSLAVVGGGLATLAAEAFLVGALAHLPHASADYPGLSASLALPSTAARSAARADATVPEAATVFARRPTAADEPLPAD